MGAGTMVKIVLVAAGIILMIMVLLSLSRRKMTETFCLMWGILSVILFCAGIFLNPTQWSNFIGTIGSLLVLLAATCIVAGAFFICIQVSVLVRKNQELAMQVSLLNQENKYMLEELKHLRERVQTDEEENTICN